MGSDNIGFVYFGGLSIDENDSSDKELCFLCGSDGEGYAERDDVVRLVNYLTTFLGSTADAQGGDMSKYTGLKDKNGTKIHVGDKVEFYFDSERGYSDKPDVNYTTMTDEVIEDEGEFYFLDHYTGGGAFAWRHAPYCEVIGKWTKEDTE